MIRSKGGNTRQSHMLAGYNHCLDGPRNQVKRRNRENPLAELVAPKQQSDAAKRQLKKPGKGLELTRWEESVHQSTTLVTVHVENAN